MKIENEKYLKIIYENLYNSFIGHTGNEKIRDAMIEFGILSVKVEALTAKDLLGLSKEEMAIILCFNEIINLISRVHSNIQFDLEQEM
jgi:hypothetical protein